MLMSPLGRRPVTYYPQALVRFMEGMFSESFEWGKPSQRGRSPILHGHYVHYDDHILSLKLILLIDYIQHLIASKSAVAEAVED